MKKLTLDWKIQKSMKPAVKSFRETIDFPTDSFETPKKSSIPPLKNHSITRSSRLIEKPKGPPKYADSSGCKNIKNSFMSARKPSRLKKCEPRNAQKSDANVSKKGNSTNVTSKCFNSFNDSFNELFFNNLSKFSDEASNGSITTSPCSAVKKPINHLDKLEKKTENSSLTVGSSKEQDFQPKKEILAENLQVHISKSNSEVPEQSLKSELKDDMLDMSKWGLPESVVDAYRSQNITTMFEWQAECLSLENVLKGGNLVYSAPTSAGKTLVAEVLMLKKIVETRKKGLMILPFVSVAREKVNYLQKLFGDAGVTVDGYMGTYNPPGGFNAVDVAICTIEKANNLINRLIEDGRVDQLGIIVVDELHMLGDPHRGYLLELLLTKLLYTCKRNNIDHIQIVGMSATLPNLSVLSLWLKADLYHTDFRPVPLHETFKVGPCIYDSKSLQLLRNLKTLDVTFVNDTDHTIYLAMETVVMGHAVLIFCPTKNWCEKLAESIAREVFRLGKISADSEENPSLKSMGSRLREVLNGDQLKDVLHQLSNSPAGLDSVLGCTVPFGVAFHHAGLTFDERDIIESAFRYGIIKFLVATSTLSSGVNLPAKRVIIRSPLFRGTLIDVLTYRQMIGRAGRKGIDTSGESILLCKETEKNYAKTLVESELRPVKSCLVMSGNSNLHSSIKRAILEIIASGVAKTPIEINQYTSCTLLSASASSDGPSSGTEIEDTVEKCLQFLIDNEFVFLTETVEEGATKKIYQPTRLGQAVLASGFAPDDSLRMLKELQLARRCFVLENDLHILYEVTPPYLSDQVGEINWMHYLSLWEQLPDGMRRVGELVGIEEQFIGCRMQGRSINKTGKDVLRLAVHQRFYAALALNDLIKEVSLSAVAQKYNCTRGILQSLQQTTSTFAGMLTTFCSKLGWYNLELLFGQFQKRVHFGIQQELCDLVRLSSINGQKARVLYNAGYETVVALANADVNQIAFLLGNTAPFETGKQQEGETEYEALKRKEAKNIWISGRKGLTNDEAAEIIVMEARRMIERELGVKNMQWKPKESVSITKNTPEDAVKNESIVKANSCSTTEGKTSTLSYNEESKISCLVNAEDFKKQMSNASVSNDINEDSKIGKKDISQLKNSVNANSLNTNKRKCDMDDQDAKIGNDSRVCKKARRESDFTFDGDQFSYLINGTFNCALPLVPGLKTSEKLPSNQMPIINVENDPADDDIIKNDDCFDLSQVAEMESIYLSHSFNRTIKNNDELSNHHHGVKQNHVSSPTVNKDLPFVSHKADELFKICSSTPVERFTNKSSVQSIDSPSTNSHDNFKDNRRNNACLASIENFERNYKKSDDLFNSPVDEFSNKFSPHSKDLSLTKSQALHICEQMNSDEEKQTFITESEKSLKTNERTISCNSIAHIEKPLTKMETQFNDCSLTESQAVYMCEKISFAEESQTLLIKAAKSHGTFEQPTLHNFSPIEKSFKKLATPIDDSSLTESQAVYMCEKISFDDETESSEMAPKRCLAKNKSIMPCIFSPIEKSVKVNILQYGDCSLTESQAMHLCEKTSVSDESQASVIESKKNHKTYEQSIPCSSTPAEKLINAKATQSNNYSLTKSQALYMCENISFKDESLSFMKKKDESHPITLKLIKDIAEESNFEFSVPDCENPDTDELFSNKKDGNILETNDPACNISTKNLRTALDFSFPFNAFSETLDADAHDTENANGKIDEALLLKSKRSAFYGISDLSLDLDTEAEIRKTSQSISRIAPNSISADRTIPFVENSISSEDSSSSLLNEVVNECVSPTPPKVSSFSRSTFTTQTPNDEELVTPHRAIKNSNHNLNTNPLSNTPITNVHVNLFSFSETSPSTKNEIDMNSRSVLADNSVAIEENINNYLETDEDGINIKVIVDDVAFIKFINDWKKINKFSLSVACEKLRTNSNIIGPQVKGNRQRGSKQCQWLSGTDISIVGISLCWEKNCTFYIPFTCHCFQEVTGSLLTCVQKFENIRTIFNKPTSRKTISVFDVKSQCKVLCEACGFVLQQTRNIIFQDPSIAGWMLNPDAGEQSLYQIVSNYLPTKMHLLEGYNKKYGGLGLLHESTISAQKRATTEAAVVFELINEIRVLLRTEKLFQPFSDMEMPILFSLAKMEQIGFGLNTKLAVSYRTDLQQKQLQLLRKAHELAGRKFNLSSPKDIARVLYKELRLSVPDNSCSSPTTNRHLSVGVSTYKKSQRLPPGLKTNKEALEKLKHLHSLPEVILNWRKISFCLSKVLMPLLKEKKFCKDTNVDRLHSTSFVYTVTGRINMHSPNLQFIPRDFDVTELNNEDNNLDGAEYSDGEICGISLRNMFIPSKGRVLLSADYSQLELRMLAHLSRDRKLISLLNSGNDVFKMIASSWKRIFINEVSDVLRQQAKQICYGMIYGIGAKTLSHQLEVNEEDAAIFMDSFKDAYPNVKEYLKTTIENCKTHGYITTLGNRKRYLPSINSNKNGERARAERQAINTTIQGSAADLFKSAIIKIELEMKKKFPDSFQPFSYQINAGSVTKNFQCFAGGFLVLQLHDEVIFEICEKDLKPMANIIRYNMENCIKLSVKLPVKIRVGSSWGNMTETKNF